MGIADLFSLLGGVALFLFGMTLMGDGLKKVAGNKLEVVLYRLSNTTPRGLALGAGVTAVIQSSSATSAMVVGFVNSGMLQLRQAIAVVLGACLGTSVTGWVLCLSMLGGGGGVATLLSTATLSSAVAVVGVILVMFSKKRRNAQIGNILLGFAVLMFGMQAMSSAVSPLRNDPMFLNAILGLSNPFIGVLLGTLIAAVLQSASAAIGILQALSLTGAIEFNVAFPIILGIGIGAAVPVLLSALGANTNGKRTAWVYLLINLLGAVIVGVVFYAVHAAVGFDFMNKPIDPVGIALVNSLFRLAYLIVLAPTIGLIEKLIVRVIRDKAADPELVSDVDRLEERFLQHPPLALEQSRITIRSMAEKAELNVQLAVGLIVFYTEDLFEKVQALEDVLDRYEDKLGSYLMQLTGKEMDASMSREVTQYLHAISDFERISDHAVGIAESAQELHEGSVQFSEEALQELDVLTNALVEILDMTRGAFIENDPNLAVHIEPLEEVIDELCVEMKMHHVERLRRGECTLEQGFIFNDLLTNYERISDHCSNIGVAILESRENVYDPHAYLQNVKEHQSAAFERSFRTYKEKFRLQS